MFDFMKKLFGKKPLPIATDIPCHYAPVDLRNVLQADEEWEVPEEWFADSDGKQIRRKKKREGAEPFCGEMECCLTPLLSDFSVVVDLFESAATQEDVAPPIETPAAETTPKEPECNPGESDCGSSCSLGGGSSDYNSTCSSDSNSSSYDSGSSGYDSGSSSYDSGSPGGDF